MSKVMFEEEVSKCEACKKDVREEKLMISNSGDLICPKCFKKTKKSFIRKEDDDYSGV